MRRAFSSMARSGAVLAVLLVSGLTVVAGAVGIVGAPSPAAAADCPPFKVEQTANRADVVVHARVTGAPRNSKQGAVYPVSIQVPFKGDARGSVKVVLHDGPCQPSRLTVDEDYVFFLKESGNRLLGAGNTASVRPYTDELNQQLHDLLDAPTTQPREVTFSTPSAGEPSTFTRLAAPGGAFLLVGVLGLLLTRWISRRAAG